MSRPTLVALLLLGGIPALPLAAQDSAPPETTPPPAPIAPPTPPGAKPAPPAAKPAPPVAKPAEPVVEKVEPVAKKEPEKPKTYVIKSGDNPWQIAKDHGVELDELMKLNKITDAKGLRIGDTLVIPGKTTAEAKPDKPDAPAPEAKPVAKPEPEGDDWMWYTVQKGENPWTIAKKLKVDHQEVMTLNKGTDFRDLKIGQKIKVPKS